MGSNLPLVSIGLPVYNGAAFLPRALDSLLAQDYPNIELLISDNCSTDNTRDICARYAEREPRIRVSGTTENIGGVANFHRVLRQARGDYFMFAAADDHWSPNFISTLVRELDQHPESQVAMCAIQLVTDRFEPLRVIRYIREDGVSVNDLSCFEAFKHYQHGASYHIYIYGLFRRPFLRRAMPQPWPDVPGSDVFFISELILATRFRYVDEILHTRTIHAKKGAERYPDDAFSQLLQRGLWSAAHHRKATVRRILRSPFIPWHRKLAAIGWLACSDVDLRHLPGGQLVHDLSRAAARSLG